MQPSRHCYPSLLHSTACQIGQIHMHTPALTQTHSGYTGYTCTCTVRAWSIMLKNHQIMLCSNTHNCFDYASKNCLSCWHYAGYNNIHRPWEATTCCHLPHCNFRVTWNVQPWILHVHVPLNLNYLKFCSSENFASVLAYMHTLISNLNYLNS